LFRFIWIIAMRIVPFGLCVIGLALFFGSSPASASGCCYDPCSHCKHHEPYWKHHGHGCGGGCGHHYPKHDACGDCYPKHKPCHGCQAHYPKKSYYGAHSYYPKHDGYDHGGYYPKKHYKAYSYYPKQGGYGDSYGGHGHYPKPQYKAYSHYPKPGYGGGQYDHQEDGYDGGEGGPDYPEDDEAGGYDR
jgi:hypothetical protein